MSPRTAILVAVSVLGCRHRGGPEHPAAGMTVQAAPVARVARPLADGGRALEDFDQLLDGSLEALRLMTQAHTVWGFGKFARWDFDQEQGVLRFSNPDGTVASAPAQIVGSFDAAAGTWMWAWANPSIDKQLQRASIEVREYGRARGIRRLTEGEWPATEDDAWKMTALAVRLGKLQGAYRGPAGSNLFAFFAFGDVKTWKLR
jgi:uncharacterized protein DUF6882